MFLMSLKLNNSQGGRIKLNLIGSGSRLCTYARDDVNLLFMSQSQTRSELKREFWRSVSWPFDVRSVKIPWMPEVSLRSKRFRRVWEQRKTEERGFRYFACAENGARAKKRTVRVGEGRKEPLADKPLDFENSRSPANGSFQNPGVCPQAVPSFPSPTPTVLFLALAPFSAQAKYRKPRSSVFLC